MFYQGTNADPKGPYAGIPYDYMNPAYEGLYGKRSPDRIMRQEPEFAQQWYERTKELIDKYNPDLIYFDGPLPNGIYGQQLAAHFYNTKLAKDGTQQGVLTIKRPGEDLRLTANAPEKMNYKKIHFWLIPQSILVGSIGKFSKHQ